MSKFTVRHHARDAQGQWFRYSGETKFDAYEPAIKYAVARVRSLSGHRCDVWRKRRVIATAYPDDKITTFDLQSSR